MKSKSTVTFETPTGLTKEQQIQLQQEMCKYGFFLGTLLY